MKQTAVEFIVRQLDCLNRERKDKLISAETFFNHKINLIEEAKRIEKENMINFLKSAFAMDGFDYDKFYNNFLLGIEIPKQDFPKTQIDWSGFPKSTQEQVGFIEPNIINEWLEANGNPEIAKQVEEEAIELCGETLEHKSKFIVFTLQDGEDWVQYSMPLVSFEKADDLCQKFRDKKMSYLICQTLKQGYNGK